MSSRAKLFPYPELRALEDAAFEHEVVPTRIHSLLLPVWKVTVQATVVVAEDYDLIDRHLSRGIAEAGLTTTAELAAFFSLDPLLVERALRALEAIGHLGTTDGRWWLTEVGLRSVREGRRYEVANEDRRVLYFDGFASRPLTKVCYDPRKVTLLPPDELPTGNVSRACSRGGASTRRHCRPCRATRSGPGSTCPSGSTTRVRSARRNSCTCR
ncbi:hypothetical protein Q5530_34450 [Saccharothrix sp. BKS2]|uniref:hypothetical protein n=1 Tax=Saccharothrix sp. BKS2 TaxID=3064400 RepID=UPI0039EBB745